ncbi:uncharacterized protein LOC115624923 [Scaptodrosophila lebanonensis]|uniref:Uncharacterized protein LOC115624923 n=1 Tax=Drosophila lebanonensis TaxID=7225 RepID=A0A6J2THZ2_DROLE|nr:uncharacterized protein LOC115624923 [Scaptodrosophila lebanonensis]
MLAENVLRENTSGQSDCPTKKSKGSRVGAAVNMKKLLKAVKQIFVSSVSGQKRGVDDVITHTCATEEEHQNWLNEQLEAQNTMST